MDAERERVFTVAGMTCGHCATAVADEVGRVPGVAGVDVDLKSGLLTVSGERVEDDAVAAAVVEAGYEVRP